MLRSSEELRRVGKSNRCCKLNTHTPSKQHYYEWTCFPSNVSLMLARGDKLSTLGKRVSHPERGSRLTVMGLNPSFSPPPAGRRGLAASEMPAQDSCLVTCSAPGLSAEPTTSRGVNYCQSVTWMPPSPSLGVADLRSPLSQLTHVPAVNNY